MGRHGQPSNLHDSLRDEICLRAEAEAYGFGKSLRRALATIPDLGDEARSYKPGLVPDAFWLEIIDTDSGPRLTFVELHEVIVTHQFGFGKISRIVDLFWFLDFYDIQMALWLCYQDRTMELINPFVLWGAAFQADWTMPPHEFMQRYHQSMREMGEPVMYVPLGCFCRKGEKA